MTCAPSRHRATTTSVPSCACVRPHMRLCTHARPNRACTRYSLFTKAPVRWVVSSSKDAGIGTPELTAAAWKVALVDSMAARLSWRSCSSAGLVSPAARGMDCKQVDIAGRVLGRGRAFAVDGPRGRGGGWEEGRKGRLPLCREGKRRARCDKKRRTGSSRSCDEVVCGDTKAGCKTCWKGVSGPTREQYRVRCRRTTS